MLFRNINTMESYIHICKGKRFKDMPVLIHTHDIASYIDIYDKDKCKYGVKFLDVVRVNFCPICGADIEKEERGGWNEYAQDQKEEVKA